MCSIAAAELHKASTRPLGSLAQEARLEETLLQNASNAEREREPADLHFFVCHETRKTGKYHGLPRTRSRCLVAGWPIARKIRSREDPWCLFTDCRYLKRWKQHTEYLEYSKFRKVVKKRTLENEDPWDYDGDIYVVEYRMYTRDIRNTENIGMSKSLSSWTLVGRYMLLLTLPIEFALSMRN